jgi:sulfur relay (sulfurtransferase) DsrC/TusE family protein
MQGETTAASGYANAAVAQTADDDLAEAAIDAFENLATVTAVDRGIVATLTDANYRLVRQLEENFQAVKEIRALLKKERNDHGARKTFAPYIDNYCWTRGYRIAINHTS